MEYTISGLAGLAGVSARTLRYYDEIGLLKPQRISGSGYRIYGQGQVDCLQQILFYRELGMGLDEIGNIISAPGFDGVTALKNHLDGLLQKQRQLELLIGNVKKTISAAKGEIEMNDSEKFEGFKQKLVQENEVHYGTEIRQKYGDAEVDASNAKLQGMSRQQYDAAQRLSAELNAVLADAFSQGDPASEAAQRVCGMHRKWLGFYWNSYSKEAHLGLAQMYVDDPRFTAYYDEIAPGCAVFLRDALMIYCK